MPANSAFEYSPALKGIKTTHPHVRITPKPFEYSPALKGIKTTPESGSTPWTSLNTALL